MIIIWGKGKVWQSIAEFLTHFWIEHQLIDDKDCLQDGKISSQCKDLLLRSNLIVPSPWVPSHHQVYTDFRDKLIWELDLVWQILQDRGAAGKFCFVGVTGTDGKSTVSHLIYQGLVGLGQKAFLAGNFDVPFAKSVLENLEEGGTGVVEVSSFMAYLLKSIPIEILAWTNFAPDHLNWHKDLKDYFLAKLNLAHRAKKVLAWFDIEKVAKDFSIDIENIDWQKISLNNWQIKNPYLVGEHNQKNLVLAAETLKSLGFSSNQVGQVLSDIKGLPHRIGLVGQTAWWAKVRDDGKSTTPQSLGAALKAMDGKVVLIAWGYDKGAEFEVLKDLFKDKVSFWVFLGQTAPRFAKIFDQLGLPYVIADSMPQAVEKAMKASWEQNIPNVLFSPACASFDMFKNRKDRVAKFLQNVKKYLI